MSMTIWIDADAAPRDVKEVVFRAARRLQVRALVVANQPLATPRNNPHVEAVWVQSTALDAVDDHIAEHAAEGDLAVTADIPLAATLVERGIIVLDPRGDVYTEDNVGGRLAIRDFMDSLRGAGVDTGGPKPYGPRDKRAFAAALDRVLGAARRETDRD